MRLDPLIKEKLKNALNQELQEKQSLVIVSAGYQLNEEEVKHIMKHFPQYSSYRVQTKIDPDIIGGFVIQAGSQKIDLSIRHVLQMLFKKMYESN